MNHVELHQVTKAYGTKTVLRELDLGIGAGELVALLGPSGCGKSTTLRILAGLEHADSGSVTIAGKDVSKLSTRKRNMGIVFQAYSLFPHLSATQNVAYGLKIRGVAAAARTKRAEELLELVGLAEHREKFPAQMSGGQQQRVALARALAIEPDVLLLDEPLSALDAKVRSQLRDEIRHIQLSRGIATLLVTHDQEEAIIMADRVGVMREGRIEQIDTPAGLYGNPRTPFISHFVGVCNRVPGKINSDTITALGASMRIVNTDSPAVSDGVGVALIRPEDIVLSMSDSSTFQVMDTQLRGAFTSVMVQDQVLEQPLRVDMPTAAASSFPPGTPVHLRIHRADTVVEQANENEKRMAEQGGTHEQAAYPAHRN